MEEEVRIQGQRLEVIRRYSAIIKDAQREPDSNLTPAESAGKLKLQVRVKAGKVVIFPTDKSDKLEVSVPETYMEAARVRAYTGGTRRSPGTGLRWWRRGELTCHCVQQRLQAW